MILSVSKSISSNVHFIKTEDTKNSCFQVVYCYYLYYIEACTFDHTEITWNPIILYLNIVDILKIIGPVIMNIFIIRKKDVTYISILGVLWLPIRLRLTFRIK